MMRENICAICVAANIVEPPVGKRGTDGEGPMGAGLSISHQRRNMKLKDLSAEFHAGFTERIYTMFKTYPAFFWPPLHSQPKLNHLLEPGTEPEKMSPADG